MRIQREATLKAALLPKLMGLIGLEPDALLIEELGVEQGQSRIDLAVFGSSVYGFEIKAVADTLHRFERQATYYGKLVDFAYLVLTSNHLAAATKLLPPTWGLILAHEDDSDVRFELLRLAAPNHCRDRSSLARLLWRDEALETLTALGLDRGVRTKAASVLHERLAASLEIEALTEIVSKAIQERAHWGTRRLKPSRAHELEATQAAHGHCDM